MDGAVKKFANPLEKMRKVWYTVRKAAFVRNHYQKKKEVFLLKHITTVNKADLKASAVKGGCGTCTSSCQSACKTSCTVANQKCESVK